jgi:hypothetical protein
MRLVPDFFFGAVAWFGADRCLMDAAPRDPSKSKDPVRRHSRADGVWNPTLAC